MSSQLCHYGQGMDRARRPIPARSAQRIRRARLAKGWDPRPKAVAETEIPLASWVNWETRGTTPDTVSQTELIRVFDVDTVNWFLGRLNRTPGWIIDSEADVPGFPAEVPPEAAGHPVSGEALRRRSRRNGRREET